MKLARNQIAIMVLDWLVLAFLSCLNRFAEAAEPDKLNVCYSSIAATSITTWVPKEAGIYKKYGLDVSIIYVAGAQAITTLDFRRHPDRTRLRRRRGSLTPVRFRCNDDRYNDQRHSHESWSRHRTLLLLKI